MANPRILLGCIATVRTVPPVRGIDERLEQSDSAEYLEAVHEMVASAPHFQLSWDQALPADDPAWTTAENEARAAAQRVLPALVGPGPEAVSRNSETVHAKLGHGANSKATASTVPAP